MGSGNYDHPSYLTRQQLRLSATAGANGTSAHTAYNSAMRIRQVTGCVAVAGTIGTNVAAIVMSGTSTLGSVTFGTAGNTIGAVGTSSDLNATVPAGTVVSVKNGADATATTHVVLEAYVDPAGSWTGINN